MKNQKKITELKEYIDASGIEESIQTLQELLGEYIQLEKMQEKRKEIGLGFLGILDAIWKMDETLRFVLEESEHWEETERKEDNKVPYW